MNPVVPVSAREYLMQLVGENEFLRALPPSDAELLSQAAEYVTFNAGQTLFKKGDLADSMFFVVDGLILITDDNDEDVLAVQEKHTHFGEQGLLDINEGRRTAGAKAAEDTKLQDIRRTHPQHAAPPSAAGGATRKDRRRAARN